MGNSFDVIVVGIGAMGSATCAHLAERGARVLGIEQHDIPNTLGSSHGFTRLIRLAYFEHPDYVPLLRRSYELWERLSRESGNPILNITGGVYIGTRSGELVDGSLRASELHGLDHELLDAAGLNGRFSQFRMRDDQVAVFDPQAGFLRPELAIASFVARATTLGSVLRARERVIEWKSTGDTVSIVTDRGQYQARSLVLCAGCWTTRLLNELRLPLVVTRQTTGFVQPARNHSQFSHGHMPVWAVEFAGGGLYYGAPIIPDRPGLKVALHRAGETTNPDSVDRSMRSADVDEIRWMLPRHLPDADGPVLGFQVCMYTNTPDGHFVIDRHPQFANVAYASPCSGHGFKFAPVVGEALADLALAGKSELPVGFLHASRFR